MSKPTGGPAFPGEYKKNFQASGSAYGQSKSDLQGFYQGMTLRDYFAAKAPEVPDMEIFPIKKWKKMEIFDIGNGMRGPRDVLHQESWAERSARWAFEYADAMLAERNKGE